MSKFKSLKYSTLNKPHFIDSKNITLETFKNICFKYFKNDLPINDNYNALNRVKGTFLGRANDDVIVSKFIKNGYIPLNTFCDLKRLDLVVAYNTIYKRIDKDDRIARYLNDNEYIYIYYKRKKDGSVGVRKNIAVNYEKHIDFIKLIRDNFISDKQSKTIIKV